MASFFEYMADFNKKMFEQGFNALIGASEQSEKMTMSFLEATPQIPVDSKNAARDFYNGSNQGLRILQKSVNTALGINLSGKSTIAQSLKEFEESVQDTFKMASGLQEENEKHLFNLIKDLPEEGQQAAKVWNDIVKATIEGHKSLATQNFGFVNKTVKETAKKEEQTKN